jgi:glycosyltransferase involved in cell wall biosynthesis
MKKLIVGITAPNSVDLLIGQLNYISNRGYEVCLLAPNEQRVTDFCEKEKIRHIPIAIERNISPFKDLLTIISLLRIFLIEKPDIINLGTPKISLLGMIAGFITRVPYRIYTCRGFRFEHESGSLKKLLIRLERVTAFCSHKVYCISQSVSDLGVALKIFPIEKTYLIANGSSNGVDLSLFDINKLNKEQLEFLRQEYQLEGTFVFGFVGRLVDRKGLKEMYEAFDRLYQANESIRLLVVGRPFWDQIKDRTTIDKLNNHPAIIMVGFQPIESVPYFLSLMDAFLLPAHWEGFGNVLIQAAAMGLPIVATEVTGVKDAVKKDYNGILVQNGDSTALEEAMEKMINDEKSRSQMAQNSIEWSKYFKPEIIWEGYLKLYQEGK